MGSDNAEEAPTEDERRRAHHGEMPEGPPDTQRQQQTNTTGFHFIFETVRPQISFA